MKFYNLIVTSVLGTVLTGCVNFNQPHAYKAVNVNAMSSMSVSVSSGSGTNAAYSCPVQSNVVPNYDWNLNGTDFFTACIKKDSSKDYWIYGHSNNNTKVCVIPVSDQQGSQSSTPTTVAGILPYNDPSVTAVSGAPWQVVLNHCAQAGDLGFEANFGNMAYNGFFIVAQADLDQMQHCLFYQDYNVCPREFSYGKIPLSASN